MGVTESKSRWKLSEHGISSLLTLQSNSSSATYYWTLGKWMLLPDIQRPRMKWTRCLPQEVAMRIKADNICQAYSSASTGSQLPIPLTQSAIVESLPWILWSFKSFIYFLAIDALFPSLPGKKNLILPQPLQSVLSTVDAWDACSQPQDGSFCFTSLASCGPWSGQICNPTHGGGSRANIGLVRVDVRLSLVQVLPHWLWRVPLTSSWRTLGMHLELNNQGFLLAERENTHRGGQWGISASGC